jgi:hypothetical protein
MLAIALGLVVATLLLSAARTGYYIAIDRQPQMSPMMFIILAPVVAGWLLLPTLLAELIFCSVWWRPLDVWQAIMIGASYSGVLLGLVELWMLFAWVAFNPITLRLLFIRQSRQISSRVG